MSTLGKIFLYVAAAGAAVALVFGFLVMGQFNETKATLVTTQAAKVQADKETAKAKAEALAIAQAKAEVDKSLAEAKSAGEKLTADLAEAKKNADEANAAVATAKTDAEKAKADLLALSSQLNGRTVAEIDAAKEKAEKAMQDAVNQQKIIEDALQAANAKVADLMVKINTIGKTSPLPPGISGKVTFVNRTWNFVVLDVGLSNGVVPNGELIVYRKNNFLGKVKVTTVDNNTSVADILPDTKGDIQVGDYVLN